MPVTVDPECFIDSRDVTNSWGQFYQRHIPPVARGAYLVTLECHDPVQHVGPHAFPETWVIQQGVEGGRELLMSEQLLEVSPSVLRQTHPPPHLESEVPLLLVASDFAVDLPVRGFLLVGIFFL